MKGDLKNYVTEERFHVTSVLCEAVRATSGFDPAEKYRTTIGVAPYDEGCPVRCLQFSGNSIVQTGDSIDAKLLKCERHTVSGYGEHGPTAWPAQRPRSNYIAVERAIEITRLSADLSTALRTERSLDYSNHVHQH